MKYPAVHYHDYLKLDQLLSAQLPKSVEYQKPAHDEMLFIVVHQTYELWFRQILFELDSVLNFFREPILSDAGLAASVHRLERIKAIMHLILGQIDVLETMTPMDFLEFRDLLYPASGFQSFQFRLIENKLGLQRDQRLSYSGASYLQFVGAEQKAQLIQSEEAPSLFACVQSWLERTPYVRTSHFDFWQEYRKAVEKMLNDDQNVILQNPLLKDEQKQQSLESLKKTRASFATLFDEATYKKAQSEGAFRLSYQAVHAALFIQLYREHLPLQMPHRLIQVLVDIDETFTLWRSRHAQMALRMLGTKIGTGGSSGHTYLRQAADKHRIFTDFFNLSTFYIPRTQLPPLVLSSII